MVARKVAIASAGCTPVGTSWRPSRATRGRSRLWPSSAPSTPSNARSRTNARSSATQFTDADVVRLRRTRAGPILATFSDWLEEQHRQATPKSLFGQAIEYSRNQWASLVRYLDDARFAIDNGAAERAIRPLAIGRANWLQSVATAG